MGIARKISNALRDVFSHAVHLESAYDHARKGPVADAILAASLRHADDPDIEYAARLRRILMKTRTRHLDILHDREVAVVLDARLSGLKPEGDEDCITGAFYDRPDGRVAALWDDPSVRPGWFGGDASLDASVMLEKLAGELQAGATGDLYATRYVYGDPVTMTVATLNKWVTPENLGKSVAKYPEIRQPPSRKPPRPFSST